MEQNKALATTLLEDIHEKLFPVINTPSARWYYCYLFVWQ